MTQQEFLKQLTAALAPLSDTERSRILDYYREMICDGIESGKEEPELIDSFGTPQEIAAQILEESAAAEHENPIPTVPAVQPPSAGAYAARGPVNTILVDARHISVEIRPVPDGPVQVHFTPLESDRVSVSEQNGVFSFRHTMQEILFARFSPGCPPVIRRGRPNRPALRSGIRNRRLPKSKAAGGFSSDCFSIPDAAAFETASVPRK